MTYTELLNELIRGKHRRVIKWTRSGIVEIVELTQSKRILVTNVTTLRSFILPKRNKEVHAELLSDNEMVRLGDLLDER